MQHSQIGNRMKNNYEKIYSFKLPRRMPVIIRLDGKCFHSVARRLKWKKPFDEHLTDVLQSIAENLCREVMNVKLAYLQSDEISLLLVDYERIETESWYDNEIQKIVSVISGLASAKLTWLLGEIVSFDARVFVIPPFEVCNYFIWRQQDWERNSVQMLARANFSQKSLHGLNGEQLREKLLKEKKINWFELPLKYKRGSCIIKMGEQWRVDNKIPEFTQDRNYIEKYIPELNNK